MKFDLNVKVEQLEHLNQYIIRCGTKIYFQSYDTIICYIDIINDKLYLNGNMWDCSNTTRKHFYLWLGKFTKYWVHSNKEFKKLIKNDNNIVVIGE